MRLEKSSKRLVVMDSSICGTQPWTAHSCSVSSIAIMQYTSVKVTVPILEPSDLATQVFALPFEEKMKYSMGSQGGYFGYKMSGSQFVDEKGTPDCSQFWNIAKDDILRVGSYKQTPLQHPAPIHQRWTQLEEFMTAGHRVVTLILRVLGEQLGLDPDVLPNLHRIDRTGGDQARITHAPPLSADTISLGEHTGMCLQLGTLRRNAWERKSNEKN